mmetsp:Transcript_68518/g.185129  ORF Transcript_68518/g.185129 Transcript_68518/m.185129 type:complete len:268 (-) Transcript_68518:267-1070(-)
MAWATTMMPTCQAGCAGVSVWRTLICSGRRTGRRRGLTSTSRPGEPPKSPDRRTCRRWCPRRRPLDPLPRQPGSTTPAGGRWSRFMALKRSLAMWMRSSRRLRLAWVIIMTLVWQAGCAEASARATSSRSDRRLGRRRGQNTAPGRRTCRPRLPARQHPRPRRPRPPPLRSLCLPPATLTLSTCMARGSTSTGPGCTRSSGSQGRRGGRLHSSCWRGRFASGPVARSCISRRSTLRACGLGGTGTLRGLLGKASLAAQGGGYFTRSV